MRSPSSVRGCIAAAMAGGILLVGTPLAQGPGTVPALREAAPGEVWITRRDLAGLPPDPVPALRNQAAAAAVDVTSPSDPGNFHAFTSGLFRIAASWTASVDPESGIDYYAFAIGTGTTTDTEANIRWWQSVGRATKANVNMALTPGATYYISVRASNGANLSSNVVHSAPLTAAGLTYGAESNEIRYIFVSEGISTSGTPTSGWSSQQQAAFGGFLEKMVPLLTEIYGPPSTPYTVELVRDLRYTSSAVFFPSSEEIHMGDTVTYQLLTHEMVHAFRRDRVVASGPLWEYESTLSGFEEGFAQAVSYQAIQVTGSTLTIAGWAIDLGAGDGTGVDSVHVPLGGGEPRFLGVASYGQPRPDLGALFGARYSSCGFVLTATGVPPGEWRIITFVRNTITGTFADARVVDVTVGATVSLPAMAIDEPQAGSVGSGELVVRGWAVDRGASSGTGVDAIHVWGFPAAGDPMFLGVAAHAHLRGDIGALFGPSFTNSGFSLTVSSLAPGTYDLWVFVQSAVTGTFNQARIVRVSR